MSRSEERIAKVVWSGLLAIILVFCIMILAGCGAEGGTTQNDRKQINNFCKDRGGVLSSDYHGDTFICADDKILRDAP